MQKYYFSILIASILASTDLSARSLIFKPIADIRNIEAAVMMYKLECRKYPSTLEILIENSESTSEYCLRSFLEKLPEDPWGQGYYYKIEHEQEQDEKIVIFSAGLDKIPGTADDVSSLEKEGNWRKYYGAKESFPVRFNIPLVLSVSVVIVISFLVLSTVFRKSA